MKHILEARNWLPGIVGFVIILPTNAVFDCLAKTFAVENLFDIKEKVILFVVIKVHFIILVLYERFEHCGMNDVVNPNSLWQVQFVGMMADELV